MRSQLTRTARRRLGKRLGGPGPTRERGHGRWSEFRYDPTSDGAGILSAVRPATEALHPMTVTVDTILARDSEPIPATVGEEVVVLSIRAGSYFGFNRVGTEIWNMLSEPRRVDQIFDALSQLHDVDAETMIRDVTPFLQTLIERRLVRVVDPGGPG
jgi:Coenzyme PQQ synthesis protein D (PqqD)